MPWPEQPIEYDIECSTHQILPEGLPMKDYEIKYDKETQQITEVRHIVLGPVEFSS